MICKLYINEATSRNTNISLKKKQKRQSRLTDLAAGLNLNDLKDDAVVVEEVVSDPSPNPASKKKPRIGSKWVAMFSWLKIV